MLTSLACLVAGGLLVAVIVFGRRRSGYSHVRDTISELGEVGAPDQRRVGWGVFFPVGLGCLVLSVMASSASGPPPLVAGTRLLAASLAAGYLVAALFPCDPGSPLQGSWRQGIHNLGGGAEYVGGAASLVVLASTLGQSALGAAAVVGLGTVALSLPGIPGRGATQRVVESVLFGTLTISVWLLER